MGTSISLSGSKMDNFSGDWWAPPWSCKWLQPFRGDKMVLEESFYIKMECVITYCRCLSSWFPWRILQSFRWTLMRTPEYTGIIPRVNPWGQLAHANLNTCRTKCLLLRVVFAQHKTWKREELKQLTLLEVFQYYQRDLKLLRSSLLSWSTIALSHLLGLGQDGATLPPCSNIVLPLVGASNTRLSDVLVGSEVYCMDAQR